MPLAPILQRLRGRKKPVRSTQTPTVPSITSTSAASNLTDLINRFNNNTEDTALAIEDLKADVDSKTATTVSMNLQSIDLPPDIQSEVHLHVATLTIGSNQEPQKPTEIWDDSTNAVNFYIDTVDGVDTNTGLTSNAPIKTWEKFRGILSEKLLTDNWETYVYVKGSLQAPLSLHGVFGINPDAAIQLVKWENEIDNFEVTTNTDPLKPNALFIKTNGLNCSVTNCDFVIDKVIVLDEFTQISDSKFIFTANAKYGCIVLGKGHCNLSGLNTFDFTNANTETMPYITSYDTNALLSWNGTIELINPLANSNFIVATNGSKINYSATINGSVKVTFLADLMAEIFCSNAQNVRLTRGMMGTVEVQNAYQIDQISTHHFSSLADGLQFLEWYPFTGTVVKWMLTAKAGSGTFQTCIDSIAYPFGDAHTATFNNYDIELSREMNIDMPWANSHKLLLNVTNSTGLQDVTLTLFYRKY